MSNPYSASNRSIHLWAVGSMADYMLYVSFQALILPVFTTGFGLSSVLVGWALTLPRIFDALIDPLLGNFSDHARTRWGRRRPFLAVAGTLGACSVMAIWWPSVAWTHAAQFSYLVTISIILYFCYGLYTMTHTALGYELSDDYHIRTKVVAVRGLYSSIAALSGGWLYWLTLRPAFGNEINGIRWISVGMAAVILLTAAMPVLFSRERFQNVNRPHVNLWPAIRTTLRIKPFIVILLLRTATTMGSTLYGTMAFYISVYCVCNGDKSLGSSLSGWNGMAGFCFAVALVPLATLVSRRLGKRRGLILSYSAGLVGALTLPLMARQGHPYLLLAHMVLFGLASTILNLFVASVMPDICDLDELEHGERREGLFSAVLAFVVKLENSVCLLLGGYLLAFSGFDPQRAQQGIGQPLEVLNRLRWLAFTPFIVFSIFKLVLSFYYPLTEQRVTEVQACLATRRKVREEGLNSFAPSPVAEPSPSV